MYSRQLCQKLLTFQSAQLQNGVQVSERLPFGTIWDVFILSSDSKSDKSIVDQLKTILQKEGVGVGSSDNFIFGLSFTDNTLLSILSSVSVLAVISQDFIENERCNWSLQQACHYKVVKRETYSGILIPVICSTIGEDKIPDELQNLEPILLGNNPTETKDDWLPNIKRSITYARESYREDWVQAYQSLNRLPQNQFHKLITALTDDRLSHVSVDVENCEYNIIIDIMKGKPKDMKLRLAVNLLNSMGMDDTTVHIVRRDAFENHEHFNVLYDCKNPSDIEIIEGAHSTRERKFDTIHIIASILVGTLIGITGCACGFLFPDWKRKTQ